MTREELLNKPLDEKPITVYSMLHCYQTLQVLLEPGNNPSWIITKHCGYLEACLQSAGARDIVKLPDGTTEIDVKQLPRKGFWKKQRTESLEEALLRMSENYFDKIGLDYTLSIID